MIDRQKRKIGIITIYPELNQKHSNTGGVSGYTKNLLINFPKEKKDEVVVFADIKKDKNKSCYFDQEIEINECWEKGSRNFVGKIIKEIRNYPNLEAIHIQHEFNLFGTKTSYFQYILLLRKLKKFGKKIFVTYHGVISKKIIDLKFKEISQIRFPVFLIKIIFYLIYKGSSKYIDSAIVHEACFKEILINQYGFSENQVKVVCHGVEDLKLGLTKWQAREELGISQEKKVILFFGFLARYKGIEILLDAFNLLDDNYILILAGGKPKRNREDEKYNQWLKKIEMKFENDASIINTGFVSENKVEKYFAASDILVIPYRKMLAASGPMAFAIAYGKAFLVSDSFEKVFDKKIVFANNPYGLKDKIEEFFEDQDNFNSIAMSLREKRLWPVISQKTIKLYENIVRSS